MIKIDTDPTKLSLGLERNMKKFYNINLYQRLLNSTNGSTRFREKEGNIALENFS